MNIYNKYIFYYKMKKIDGYKGIMELDLTNVHPVYHDIIIIYLYQLFIISKININ